MSFFRKSNESPLDRLEREANDDFRLLAELGPTHFGVEHLFELREQARSRLAQFDRWRRLNTVVGATSGGWLLLGLLSAWAGYLLLAQLAFTGMTAVVLGFVAGVWLLKIKYDSRGELEYTLRIIEDELRRRGTKRGRGAHP